VTTLDITALAHGGDGVARLEDGRVAFVRDACPGDRVRVDILQDKDRFVRARTVEVLEPSPDRIEPPCPYFDRCGGCQWQHVAYDVQLAAKRSSVADALARIGGQDPDRVLEPIASPAEYGYRNKIELTVGWDAEAGVGRGMSLCYSERGSDELVPVESCLLLPKPWAGAPRALTGAMRYLWGRDGLPVERVGLRASENTGDVGLDLWGPPGAFPRGRVARVLQDAVDARTVARVLVREDVKRRRIRGTEVLAGRGYWTERLAGISFAVSPPSFFQVNTAAAEALVAAVLKAIEGRSGPVLDAFAGVGTFSVPAVLGGHDVVAVEREKSALHDLERNLEGADADAIVIPGDVAYSLDELEPIDTAVVDPPRAGLSTETLAAIASLEPGRIVYVACDPATLARDVKLLDETGYRLVSAQPIDLFPQTYHVETVAILDLRESAS
jgi:23S rRNA (uracil1939-C5)-methyltransferase